MKKVFVYAMAGALLVSSCGSYTASGAYTGSSLGSILGSAIGGLSDGPRGSDWGTIIGMAGGAVVGAAIGNAADKAQDRRIQQKREEIQDRMAQRDYQTNQRDYQNDRYDYQYGNSADSGYDPNNGGDDRIDLNIGNTPGTTGMVAPKPAPQGAVLEIGRIHFVDDNRNGVLEAGEIGRITFEVRNRSNVTLYDIRPDVIELTGNKHIYVSPAARVEQIGPGKGIRYTAMIKGGNRLKNGEAVFQVRAQQGNGRISSGVQELDVPTRR